MAASARVVLGVVLGLRRYLTHCLPRPLSGHHRFNSVPKVAIVPVLVIWFGIGQVPAIMTAFLVSFFPIAVNVATGLATIEPELEDVLRSLGARKLQIMLKVGIPRTKPYLFGSLKVAITLAFVGAIDLGDDRRQRRARLPDGPGGQQFRHAAGFRRPLRARR